MHARLPSVTEMSNSCHITTPRCGFCVKISAKFRAVTVDGQRWLGR